MWCKLFITHIILAAALWHFGSLFYHDTQYSHITNLLLCDTSRNKAPRTGSHHISRTVPFLWPQEHRCQSSCADFVGWCLSWLLLLRLAAGVAPLLLLPQNSLLTLLAFAPNLEAVSATRISLMAYSSSFIFFQPLLETHNRLPCLDYYVWLGTFSETLYQ